MSKFVRNFTTEVTSRNQGGSVWCAAVARGAHKRLQSDGENNSVTAHMVNSGEHTWLRTLLSLTALQNGSDSESSYRSNRGESLVQKPGRRFSRGGWEAPRRQRLAYLCPGP